MDSLGQTEWLSSSLVSSPVICPPPNPWWLSSFLHRPSRLHINLSWLNSLHFSWDPSGPLLLGERHSRSQMEVGKKWGIACPFLVPTALQRPVRHMVKLWGRDKTGKIMPYMKSDRRIHMSPQSKNLTQKPMLRKSLEKCMCTRVGGVCVSQLPTNGSS